MFNDYYKVFKCIESSTSVEQIRACERLCNAFKAKWIGNETYILYYDKLILNLLHKKRYYGE